MSSGFIRRRARRFGAFAAGLALLGAAGAGAQETMRKAVALAGGNMYIAPESGSAPVGAVKPGDDIAVEGQVDGYLHVFDAISGWMRTQPVAYLDDANAPAQIYAAAMQMDAIAEKDLSNRETALDTARMFYRIYDDFPAGPYTAEALYRSGAIAWKLNMADRPAREDPIYRQFPDDSVLRKVVNKFPRTGWAARADYLLLDEQFTCGRWSDKPECIAKEMGVYQSYLRRYPGAPDSADALYQITYRAAAGWTVYSQMPRHDAKKAAEFKQEVAATDAQLDREDPGSAAAAKADKLAAQVAQGIPLDLGGR